MAEAAAVTRAVTTAPKPTSAVSSMTSATKPVTVYNPEEDRAAAVERAVAPPVRDAYALRREQIDADTAAQEKARMEAIERQLAGRGLDDSGILLGAQRAERAAIAANAGRQRSAIDIEALQAGERKAETSSGREFASRESALDRALSEKLGVMGIETTQRGQDISKELGQAGIDVTRRGQDI